jgi:hypothetical protein
MEQSKGPKGNLARRKAILLILGSQIMAAVLHALARLLETNSDAQERVHPFRVLQIRLFITFLVCSTYLGCTKAPDFPLGPPELRPLLLLRAVGGIFGACGFYGKDFNSIYRRWKEVCEQTNYILSLHLIPHTERGDGTQLFSTPWCFNTHKIPGQR